MLAFARFNSSKVQLELDLGKDASESYTSFNSSKVQLEHGIDVKFTSEIQFQFQ